MSELKNIPLRRGVAVAGVVTMVSSATTFMVVAEWLAPMPAWVVGTAVGAGLAGWLAARWPGGSPSSPPV